MKPSLATLLVVFILAIPAMAQFVQPLVIGGAQPHIVSTKISQVAFCNNNTCSFAPGTSNAIGQGVVTLSNGGMFSGTWTMPTTGTATNPPGASCPDNSAFFTISSAGVLSSTAQSASQNYTVCVGASQAGLAAPNPYIQVVTLTPGGTVACDIGPLYVGNIPAPATQAGFTHCAANYDFGQTQQWTDNAGTHQWCAGSLPCSIANMSSWFTCNSGAGSPNLVYYGEFSNVGCDASHYQITTDGGKQVFSNTYYQSDNLGGHLVSRLTTQGNGASAIFNMAGQYYIEYVMRVSANNPCSPNPGFGVCPYSDLSTFTRVLGNPCFIGTDMEWDAGATSTGVGQSWWNTSCPNGNSYGGSCGGATCASPVNGTIDTTVRTWGNLTTGDGVNKSASCNYQTAGAVSGLTSSSFISCFSNTVVPPFASTAVFSQGQPYYIYFETGPDNVPSTMTISSVTTYIQRFTIWECASYATGACITNPVITTHP